MASHFLISVKFVYENANVSDSGGEIIELGTEQLIELKTMWVHCENIESYGY
jgi:hypothetical protein